MQKPNDKRNHNQRHRQSNHARIPLRVRRRLDLLPDNERQPRLEHIRHLVHGARDKRALLIIIAADLVRPRKCQSADAAAKAAEDEGGPLERIRDGPDRERHVGDNLDEAGEDDGGPSRAAEQAVGRPGVYEGGDDAHDLGDGWVDVDLAQGVALALEPQRECRLRRAAIAVVEDDVQRYKSPDVPAREDLLELGFRVRGPLRAALQPHALLREEDLVWREVPRLGYLGQVRQKEESRDGDGQRHDRVGDEEPAEKYLVH